jgi:hypothetical protein
MLLDKSQQKEDAAAQREKLRRIHPEMLMSRKSGHSVSRTLARSCLSLISLSQQQQQRR